jgi:hypothetical protein
VAEDVGVVAPASCIASARMGMAAKSRLSYICRARATAVGVNHDLGGANRR